MKRLIVLLILFSFLQRNSKAQHILCGYDLAVEHLEKQYPGYKKSIDKTFKDAKINATPLRSSASVYNIPVVVHVVWNEEEERLAESLITSQIDILNEDFQRLNEDAHNIRDIFTDAVGNPMIQFTLEEVIYVETETMFEINLLAGTLADDVKLTSAGGSDPRDVSSFLNIWVCKLQPLTIAGQFLGQILGYAYPPNDLDNWPTEFQAPDPNFDGVVLDYRVVGKNNPYTIDPGLGYEIQFAKGRSAVHEVGHYLGLRHIWGDGDLTSANSCDFDDGIEDTPNQGSSSNILSCNATQNTCSSSLDDLPDMIENYMDYSEESCQNSFTIGQIEIMRSVLENQRCQLIQDCSLSARQLESISLDIFPNPSTGTFQLNSGQVDINEFKVEILDISGNSHPINLNSNLIQLNEFAPGIYIIKGTNDKQIFQQKLIKH